MNREYAPLNSQNYHPSPFGETEQDVGLGLEIGEEHHGAPETHDGRRHSDNIPLISPGPQAVCSKPYEQFRRHRGDPEPSLNEPPAERARSSGSQNSRKSFIKRKPVHSTSSRQNIRSIYSPDFHKYAQDKDRPYAKIYDFRRTRHKLLQKPLFQWLVTIVIVAAMAGTLRAYQRKETITRVQKHVFNTIITGLAILLGMNLSSSLRSYADLMRWRLLSSTWLSLKELDLILGCGSQRNILRLIFTTTHRNKRFPFVSRMQFVCLIWLWVNMTAQVLVAMVGLVYSLDSASQNIVSLGPTMIADLSVVKSVDDPTNIDPTNIDGGGQEYTAHAYGVQGQDFPLVAVSDPLKASQLRSETVFTDLNFESMTYRFTDYNPTDPTLTHWSVRTVNVTAKCNAYIPTDRTIFYYDGEPLPGNLYYYNDNENVNRSLYVRDWMHGAVTYISDNYDWCGDRCNRVYVFQARQQTSTTNDQLAIPNDIIFDCNNTVSKISNPTAQGEKYMLAATDPAWAITGAIGWAGYETRLGDGAWEHLEYQLFSNSSYWSPQTQLTASGRFSAARYVSQYSIAALAAMDRSGPKVVIDDGMQPQAALKVTVEWRNAGFLFAVIIGLQLLVLLLVVFWANKAVITDESFLAIAKLLAPTVLTLGEQGSVLTGDEIAHAIDHQKGGEYRVFYGAKQLRDDEGKLLGSNAVMQAGIIERGMGIYPDPRKPFMPGEYD